VVGDLALSSDADFVLEHELQELGVGQAAAGGLLEAQAERRRHAAETNLFQQGIELRCFHGEKRSR
jgi:hypothetical protein